MRLESKKINQSSLLLENVEWNDMNPTTAGVLELLMKTKLFIVTTEITVEDKTVIVATTHTYQGVAASWNIIWVYSVVVYSVYIWLSY